MKKTKITFNNITVDLANITPEMEDIIALCQLSQTIDGISACSEELQYKIIAQLVRSDITNDSVSDLWIKRLGDYSKKNNNQILADFGNNVYLQLIYNSDFYHAMINSIAWSIKKLFLRR